MVWITSSHSLSFSLHLTPCKAHFHQNEAPVQTGWLNVCAYFINWHSLFQGRNRMAIFPSRKLKLKESWGGALSQWGWPLIRRGEKYSAAPPQPHGRKQQEGFSRSWHTSWLSGTGTFCNQGCDRLSSSLLPYWLTWQVDAAKTWPWVHLAGSFQGYDGPRTD